MICTRDCEIVYQERLCAHCKQLTPVQVPVLFIEESCCHHETPLSRRGDLT